MHTLRQRRALHKLPDSLAFCFTISGAEPQCHAAEEAYKAVLRTDQMMALLQQQATGAGAKDAAHLDSALQSFMKQLAVPKMPKTAAVLAEIPASGDHPGAQYRLAGDRCVLQASLCCRTQAALHRLAPCCNYSLAVRCPGSSGMCQAYEAAVCGCGVQAKCACPSSCCLVQCACVAMGFDLPVGTFRWSMGPWSWTLI